MTLSSSRLIGVGFKSHKRTHSNVQNCTCETHNNKTNIKLLTWRQDHARTEADNLWLWLNSLPLAPFWKENKTENTDPSIQCDLSVWPSPFYRLQRPPSGVPSGMPESAVWTSSVSFSSKGRDKQWPSLGAHSEQSLFSLFFPLALLLFLKTTPS